MFSKIFIIASMVFCSVGYSASQNYKKLIKNPDASVIIVNPLFKNVDGDKGISRGSDLNGVCKLFGFKSSMNSAMTHDSSKSTYTVSIGADGRLTEINSGFFPIYEIACDASNVLKPQVNTEAQISLNDDGSYSILVPKFSGKRISRGSDLNEVCRSFGFSKSVNQAMVYDNSKSTDTVSIGSNGRMTELNSGFYPIHILICDK